MSDIVCLHHPKYSGKSAPELSCQSCCRIYVETIKSTQYNVEKSQGYSTYRWLREKARRQEKQKGIASGIKFHPGAI